MAKVETLKCPECGAPLNFEKEQEYCYCSHCGHQVYKEDVHYDRRMDYEDHKLDVDKELELAKLKKEERESKSVTIMMIALMLFVVAFMIFAVFATIK